MKPGRITLGLLVVTAIAVFVGYLVGIGLHDQSTAEAAGGKRVEPNGVAPERYVYYPGTEVLPEDEIRVTACGTGLPAARRGHRGRVRPTATQECGIARNERLAYQFYLKYTPGW